MGSLKSLLILIASFVALFSAASVLPPTAGRLLGVLVSVCYPLIVVSRLGGTEARTLKPTIKLIAVAMVGALTIMELTVRRNPYLKHHLEVAVCILASNAGLVVAYNNTKAQPKQNSRGQRRTAVSRAGL
jgi:hypothetical protein